MSRPRVTAYNETSVDGRIGGFAMDGVDYYRRGFALPTDAILMGSRTAQAFGPAETPEERASDRPPLPAEPVPPGFEGLVSTPRPLLVVPDSAGVVHTWRHAGAQPWYGRLVSLATTATPPDHVGYLGRRHVDAVTAGVDRVDLRRALAVLHDEYGVRQVRTDGGGALVGALLEAGVLDELVLLVRPQVSGDPAARPLVELGERHGDGWSLELAQASPLDDGSLWLRYTVRGLTAR